ncbi:MAG: amidohydrolase family protein [Nanoarchaeota archaeon]
MQKQSIKYDAHAHAGSDILLMTERVSPGSFKDIGGLLDDMNAHGIEKSVVLPPVGTMYFNYFDRTDGALQPLIYLRSDGKTGQPMTCPYELENQNLFAAVYRHFEGADKRLLPFAAIHPTEKVDDQIRILEEIADNYGVIYGLKLHPTAIATPTIELLNKGKGFIEYAKSMNIPITVHSAVIERDKWSQPADILKVAEQNPDVRFAIAHMARFDGKSLERANDLPNCYVDTAALVLHVALAKEGHPVVKSGQDLFDSDYSDPYKVLADLVNKYPDTIIFGTDNPAHYWVEPSNDVGGEGIFRRIHTLTEEISPLRQLRENLKNKISQENTERFLFGNLENFVR